MANLETVFSGIPECLLKELIESQEVVEEYDDNLFHSEGEI